MDFPWRGRNKLRGTFSLTNTVGFKASEGFSGEPGNRYSTKRDTHNCLHANSRANEAREKSHHPKFLAH